MNSESKLKKMKKTNDKKKHQVAEVKTNDFKIEKID